jgi:hypothetical protein
VDGGLWWLETALVSGDALPASARIKAFVEASCLAFEKRDLERAIALGEEGLTLAREAGDKVGLARTLQALGMTMTYKPGTSQCNYERATALYNESMALAQKTGDRLVIILLGGLGRTSLWA